MSTSELLTFAQLGFRHIVDVEALDHILFLVALAAIYRLRDIRSVLWVVTAFTVGHSVTLALAALEIVSVPQAPVEVLIAVTIYLLAVELARNVGEGSTLMRRRPWAMAFSFGLLHGLGFAGALREAGLPSGDVPLALFSFNVGVELGQLAFIGGVLAVVAIARKVREPDDIRNGIVRWAPYGIGSLAAFWFVERVVAFAA